MMEIEVCSNSEPETELGVATSATALSLLDRLRYPAQFELSRKRISSSNNALSCQHYARCFWLLLCSKLCWHYIRHGRIFFLDSLST